MAYDSGDYLFRVVLNAASGLPEDEVVNDWAASFDAGSPSSTDLANAAFAIDRFYDHTQTNGHKVGSYISNQIDRATTHHCKIYKIVTGALGSPVQTENMLGPSTFLGTNGLPTEVNAVLSMHADLTGILEDGPSATLPSDEEAIDEGAPTTHTGVTRPRARRRGRVYIGPLGDNAIDGATPPYRLDATFVTTMAQAGSYLKDHSLADVGWSLSVWSRSDTILRNVQTGWVDNAPDTQRRRGPAASARTNWP